MKVGYARTSTLDQTYGLEAQLEQLQANGVEKVFSEQVSSVGDRTQFNQALEFMREGDSLVITKLDRGFRSVSDMINTISTLEAKGCSLQILDTNIDTSSATGKLQVNILASVAQFEREVMLERQREGIQRAKAEGKYKGRKSKIDKQEVLKMKEEGLSNYRIAKELNVNISTIGRLLKR